MAWIMSATAFVWPMIPAIGFLYSGLGGRRSAVAMVFQAFMSICITSFQWFFWGYTLAFSKGGAYIGDLRHFGMKGVLDEPIDGVAVPCLLYCLFQLVFAAATVAIATGGMSGRGRNAPMLVWQFCWLTLVYAPIAHWVWAAEGWVYKLGTLDFAGGTPVHVSSGASALAYTVYLGLPWSSKSLGSSSHSQSQSRSKATRPERPHNPMHVVFATIILWGGWLGFDGGSSLAMNMRGVMAASMTNLAAACGGIAWCLIDYGKMKGQKRWSVVSVCNGAIAGLVGITPACGFVGMPAAVFIGVITATICNLSTKVKHICGFEDPADVAALHLIGGIAGNIFTGIFAQASVAANDGVTVIDGGWLDGNWIQLGYQLADTTAATLYAFGMSFALCALIDHIPGLHLRASENQIERGLDEEETLELFGEREDEFEERDALERSDGSRRAMATPREEEERKDPPSGCKGEMEITVAELHP